MGASVCDSCPKFRTMRKKVEKIVLNFSYWEQEKHRCETSGNVPSGHVRPCFYLALFDIPHLH